MGIREILINALRNRVLPLFNRIRLYLAPSYLKGRVVELIRTFFQKILNVRPRDKDDYYPMARWLVSKRLAYAIVIFSGLLSAIYLVLARPALLPGRGDDNIKTYDYNSILLKFAKGKVRIRGKSGYLAYEGDVKNAACNGKGTLKNPAGVVVYEGNFESSMYEGDGRQYYPDGTLEYNGNFHQNLYSGIGKLYRSTGTMEYEGEFTQNEKDGTGKLYDAGGNLIYNGEFSRDHILYSSLIGKRTQEMAGIYTGKRKLYADDQESVRFCEDIGCMTEEILPDDSIDEDATVMSVYVDSTDFYSGGKSYQSFDELSELFGAATYTGESYATLPELLMINRLNDASDKDVINGSAEITLTDVFKEYTTVAGYEDGYVVWLHSYEKDGLVYNFVSARDDSEFAFYYILPNDLSDEK